jgi:hypothetical protein
MDSDVLILFSILEAGCLTPCRARITHWFLMVFLGLAAVKFGQGRATSACRVVS